MNIQPGKLKKQRKSAQTAASTLGARLAAVVKFAFFLGIIAAFLNIYIYLNQKISETDRAIRKTGQQIEKTEREIAQLRIRREQLSRSMILCGMMLLVAIRVGCSIWLTNWLAASKPSWKELRSIEVRRGEVRRANSELLKETIDKSRGMEMPLSVQSRSSVTARMSSLTTIAVGRSSRSMSACSAASCISSACISMQSSA